MFKNKNEGKNKGPRGGWEDDDNEIRSSNRVVNKTPVFQRREDTMSKPVIEERRQNINIELKLVDDLIHPTGISLKPTENVLKEFGRRVKSLDKEIIFGIIMDKLNNYENVSEGNNVKSFTKLLYVVEYLVQLKVDELYQGFVEQKYLFKNIKEHFHNKKAGEVAENILNIICPEEKKEKKVKENNVSLFVIRIY